MGPAREQHQPLDTSSGPPCDLDAEESVLGAMLLTDGAARAGAEALTASDFYRASHGVLFEAIAGLSRRGEPADAITVVDELRRTGRLTRLGNDECEAAERVHELGGLVP